MSTELQELLAHIEKIAAKDHEMGHVLKSLVDYLAAKESAITQPREVTKGSSKHAN